MDYTSYAPAPRTEESSRNVAMFLGVMISLSGFMTFFVFARIYCRAYIVKMFTYADWLIIVAFCLIWLSVCNACIGTRYGIGVHSAELALSEQGSAIFWFTISCFPSTVGLSVPKIAIVSLLCQVFDPMPWHRALLWIFTIIGFLNSLASGVSGVFHCSPIQAAWDWTITDAKCLDLTVVFDICYYVTVYAAVLDLWLALYPAIMLKDLNTRIQKRIGLTLLLSIGLLATGISFYKVSLVAKDSADFTYDMVELLIVINAEATLIMIGVCAPTMVPLFQKLYRIGERMFSSNKSSASTVPNDQPYASIGSNGNSRSAASSEKKRGYWTRNMQSALGGDDTTLDHVTVGS